MAASMRCYECKRIKRCVMHLERDENDATVGVYYCATCVRHIRADAQEAMYDTHEEHDLGGEA